MLNHLMATLQAFATLTGGEVPQDAKDNITAAYNECMETDSAGSTGSYSCFGLVPLWP